MNYKNTSVYDETKKILKQLYKIPRKFNMSYGTQNITFLKCSANLKNSVS